ncbi:MAG: Small GTP-binding domain protein [Promethearchaeota archaeon]|nr:MAG: Small GTP-binding domain protein [Candidatus Lokiarchaeota archaeon]
MSGSNISLLFKNLCDNFFNVNQDVEAVIVSDRDGLVIVGEKREEINMEIVSVLTSVINPVLERIRDEFSFQQFGTASFDTENHRLLFISIGKLATVSLVIDPMASIDKVSPYGYFLAEKISQILNAQSDDMIQLEIPNFEYEVKRADRLNNQIYEMHLDTGGKYRFKFIIVGDHEVGKTSIVRRFVENKFSTDYRATIGLNILSHSIDFLGNEVKFSIWDIGGQRFFQRFFQTYYAGSQAAFIVFDLTNKPSFENVVDWFNQINSALQSKELPVIIIGNKSDLEGERVVSYQEGVEITNKLAEEGLTNVSYIETSALTGDNVKDAFRLISYHYIMKSKDLEEERLKKDVLREIEKILQKNRTISITFITKSQYWNPGLQILNSILSEFKIQNEVQEKNKHLFEYEKGITLKNYTYDSMDVATSDGVLCIFDARNQDHIKPEWKDIVIDIINTLDDKKVALIGIRISENSDWSTLLEEFDVNNYLEKKMISLLFFKIGEEYRFELFDQLKVMFNYLNTIS